MKLKKYLKETESVPMNATGDSVAGTGDSNITWKNNKKKKYKDILARMGINTHGCSCTK